MELGSKSTKCIPGTSEQKVFKGVEFIFSQSIHNRKALSCQHPAEKQGAHSAEV